MSIPDDKQKINPGKEGESLPAIAIPNRVKLFVQSDLGKDVLIILVVIFVGIVSFLMGRLSLHSNDIKINYANKPAQALTAAKEASNFLEMNPSLNKAQATLEKAFFASKRGKKYYPADCSAGKSIKPENRIYFSDNISAEKSGYELSTACD